MIIIRDVFNAKIGQEYEGLEEMFENTIIS